MEKLFSNNRESILEHLKTAKKCFIASKEKYKTGDLDSVNYILTNDVEYNMSVVSYLNHRHDQLVDVALVNRILNNIDKFKFLINSKEDDSVISLAYDLLLSQIEEAIKIVDVEEDDVEKPTEIPTVSSNKIEEYFVNIGNIMYVNFHIPEKVDTALDNVIKFLKTANILKEDEDNISVVLHQVSTFINRFIDNSGFSIIEFRLDNDTNKIQCRLEYEGNPTRLDMLVANNTLLDYITYGVQYENLPLSKQFIEALFSITNCNSGFSNPVIQPQNLRKAIMAAYNGEYVKNTDIVKKILESKPYQEEYETRLDLDIESEFVEVVTELLGISTTAALNGCALYGECDTGPEVYNKLDKLIKRIKERDPESKTRSIIAIGHSKFRKLFTDFFLTKGGNLTSVISYYDYYRNSLL